MLPLDPVKELVRITRVKFPNPSMAFRICQLKNQNETNPTTKTNQNLSVRILEEKAFILTEIQSWINGNFNWTTKIASLYLKNLQAYSVYKCLSSNSVSLLNTHNFHFLNKVTMILGKRCSKAVQAKCLLLRF